MACLWWVLKLGEAKSVGSHRGPYHEAWPVQGREGLMAQICSLLAHAYNYGVFILCGSSKGWGRREGEGWDSAFGHPFCSWAPRWASTCILGSRLYLRMTFCALNPLISVMDTGLMGLSWMKREGSCVWVVSCAGNRRHPGHARAEAWPSHPCDPSGLRSLSSCSEVPQCFRERHHHPTGL